MWQLGSYGTGGPDASFLVSLPYMNKSNDKVNSVVNRGYTSRARFYEGANYSGLYITLNREGNLIGEQWRDPNLSNGTDATTANWANRISSGKFVA